jgi:2'-5' RNA ligase
MKPGDRLVCAFVEPQPAGHEFKDWPLHVTIVPWFRTPASSDELAGEAKAALNGIGSFKTVAGEAEQFGYQKSKTANLIRRPTPFMIIEQQVRRLLKNHGAWLVDETTRKKRDYKPHVTAQKSTRLQLGEKFRCDRLYIVEQKGRHKEVGLEIPLG